MDNTTYTGSTGPGIRASDERGVVVRTVIKILRKDRAALTRVC